MAFPRRVKNPLLGFHATSQHWYLYLLGKMTDPNIYPILEISKIFLCLCVRSVQVSKQRNEQRFGGFSERQTNDQ